MITDKQETRRAYNQLAGAYHSKRINEQDFNKLIDQPTTFSLVGDVRNKEVLDAGCGSGIYSKILAKNGAKVYGLDISEKMINLAADYCKDYKIEFRQGSIDKIPYKNNKFDIIVASLVVHYLKKPEKAFKEFNRVLKKGGILVFSTSHPVCQALQGIKNKKGRNIISIIDYFKRGKFYWSIHGSQAKIPSFKIGLEELTDLIYQNGFIIEKIKEPYLKKEHEKLLKGYRKQFIDMPAFISFKCKKLR